MLVHKYPNNNREHGSHSIYMYTVASGAELQVSGLSPSTPYC